MEEFEDNSIDSIVTDGPYGLGFMNKKWDKFTSKEYQEFSLKWGTKALRVLKPGSYCASFSAPKKYHRMACGLEDAGFKIKEMINWEYGSGFPKNLNISLAINKYLGGTIERGDMIIAPDGQSYDKRKKLGSPLTDYCYGGDIIEEEDLYEKIPTNPEALKWLGWGTGLKPAHEAIVLAQKPYKGTYAENILKWGVGGLNIDACRIDYLKEGEDPRVYDENKNITRGKHENATIKYAPDGNAHRMFKPNKGRWPSNLILTHHPECQLIGGKKIGTEKREKIKAGSIKETLYKGGWKPIDSPCYANEIMDDNKCHPDCPIKMIDEQSGISGGGTPKHNSEIKRKPLKDDLPSFNSQNCGFTYENLTSWGNIGDKGGASRFFYCAKAYKSERNAGCEKLYWEKSGDDFKKINKKQYNLLHSKNRAKGNPISTLKPINLMRYLIRLVTPPNGIILDQFAGSGTTGIACIIEGFNSILIEKRKLFAEVIIPKRLKWWEDPNHWAILNDHPLLPKIQLKIKKAQNMSLDIWA